MYWHCIKGLRLLYCPTIYKPGGLRMAYSRLALLPGKIFQKMCQASLIAFIGLLGLVVILGKVAFVELFGITIFLRNIFRSEQVISLALGVALWLLPNSYFVIKIMRRLGQVSGRDLLNIFYRAELIKLFFSGIFFIMVIKLLSINIPFLLLAYFASQLVFWLLLIMKSKEGLL